MKRRNLSASAMSRASLFALVAWATLGAACAEERDPINRVQANAMDKHFFIGQSLADAADDPEFYWRNYVVDASASQSLIGVGSWGHVDRIRWEITENLLVARKAYQIADGEDDKGIPASQAAAAAANLKGYVPTPNGTIVAAFTIESHFDIRRSYNPQTGEELNIVEENTTDRPWQERENMRVDWSKNLVDNNPMWEDMFTGRVFGKFSITPVSYYVSDPNADDAIHVDAKSGYLDITNKYSLTPEMSDSPFSDFSGQIPTCVMVGLYTGSSTFECDAQEATVRSSFLRIDPQEDFEPLDNTRATLDVVGNPGGVGDSRSVGVVSAGRQGWDPQYGFTDALYHRFAYIHNLWKKSHQDATCGANDDTDHNGTADACENAATNYSGSSGAQCDAFVGKCTIPLRDRELKSVGYWVNKEAPDDLLDALGTDGRPAPGAPRGALEDLIFSWNQLLSVSVATSREVECRRTGGGSRDECHTRFFDSTNDPATKQMVSYGGWLTDKPKETTPALTFCHNPVRVYDLTDTCGAVGEKARVGDIRKNFVFYWPYESRAPWGGIANWNADPLTGRIIGAAAQIMGRSATYAAALQRDIIQVALGDTKLEDILDGVPAQTYARQLTNGSAPRALSVDELSRRTASVDLEHLRSSLGVTPFAGATEADRVKSELLESRATVADPRETSTALLEYDALAKVIQGTKYEAQLVDSHWLVGALGAAPDTSLDDTALNLASPLRGLDPGRRHALQDLIGEGLHARGVCYLGSEAPAAGSIYMPSLAGWFKAKYGALSVTDRGNAIYQDLFKEAVKGIALHEIGHSLGLLHQFASSWDAVNYDPQYWQLRTNEGQAVASCNGKPRTGDADSCMGPRYLDPPTLDEQGLGGESRPAIEYFGNTSTMEYQLERGGETVGLGTYDQHAMKALYGRVLETFDDRTIATGLQQSFKFKNWSQLQDRDIVDGRFAHYTTTARQMGVFDTKRDCRPATDEEKATAGWRVVHGKVCAPPPKDHWSWQDFKSDSLDGGDATFNAPYWHVVAKDVKGDLVRWPYRYGTSHNAYFHTNDSDAGADAYEVTINTSRKFALTYPWAYFRRHNREYAYPEIPATTADRYFDRMRSYHWLVATDLSRVASASQLSNDDDLRPAAVAQTEMFNMLASAVLMPEPGDYYSSQTNNQVHQPVDSQKLVFDMATAPSGVGAQGPTLTLGIGEGRFIGEEFDNDLGGSWQYLDYIKHAGFTVEKAMAIQALVDGRPTLFTISRDNFLDGRGVKINFRNDMPDAIDRLVGGVLAQDWETVAMYSPAGDDPTPVQPDLASPSADSPLPDGARVLFPNVGYKQQLASVISAALFSRLASDMTLVNKMRIWLDGEVGGINVPDAEQVRFTDPNNGYTYVARKYGNETVAGKLVERGIASRMIAHATALLAAAYDVSKDAKTGEVVRDAYGQPTVNRGDDGQPKVQDSERASELTLYIGLLDALREVGFKLGYGPLGGAASGGD